MRKQFFLLSWVVLVKRTFLPNAYTPGAQVIAISDGLDEVLIAKILKRLLPDLNKNDEVTVLGISEVPRHFTENYRDFTNINNDDQ